MRKIVANFSIEYHQLLNQEGKLVGELPSYYSQDSVLKFYQMMQLTRHFDAKAVALQRTGQIGTYPSNLGHEAIGIGMASAMQDKDVFCPYYRDIAAQLWRGVTMEEILLFWGGNEEGNNYKNAPACYDLPVAVPIASQLLYACGIAKAFKLTNSPQVVVTTVGDGGTSRGDFYEAINIAGVWNLPIVFVVNNNGWAISIPRDAQTKASTLAQKAIAAGIKGLQVDGNDVLAVHSAVKEAIAEARQGEGPTLIEALTYRLGDHTTADDARRYRKTEELSQYQALDPISRLKNYLYEQQLLTMEQDTLWAQECQERVQQAAYNYLAHPKPSIDSMFAYLYHEAPPDLIEQKKLAHERV